MEIIVVLLVLCIIVQAILIRMLKAQLLTYKNTWAQVEKMTDHNQSGDIIIHIDKIPNDK